MHSLCLPFLKSRQVLKDSFSLLENVLSKSSFVVLLTMEWLMYLMCRGYWSTAEWPYYWLYPFCIAPLKFVIVRRLKLTAAENKAIVSWMWINCMWTVNYCRISIAGCSVLISVKSACVNMCVFYTFYFTVDVTNTCPVRSCDLKLESKSHFPLLDTSCLREIVNWPGNSNTGCFERGFTMFKEYINLFRRYVQCFEMS
jgi:hypothetical protein